MIDCDKFLSFLIKNQINFFTGVPDSLFKYLCNKLEKSYSSKNFITANEGGAIGLGIGYNLATKKVPLIYLQNSGLGNTINPIISMANNKVYSIPLFLLIGWRGEISNNNKQIKDEPQHKKQGLITEKMLKVMGIKYKILSKNSNYKQNIISLKKHALKKSEPVALLVRKGVFNSKTNFKKDTSSFLSREDALKEIINSIGKKSIKVSTTGMLSRELNEINIIQKSSNNTFMCVGSMGHAISIATGLALKKNKKKIFCFDGDGSFVMHLGSSILSAKLNNLVHIVFNNRAHDSVGGQKTTSSDLPLFKIAKSLGYKICFTASSKQDIKKIFSKIKKLKKSTFVEIVCKKGFRKNLTRPKKKMILLKNEFAENI